MRTRIATAAALRALPESWGLILATIGTGRRAWSTTAEIETPDREALRAGAPPIDASCCPAMAEMGSAGPGAAWLARWEVAGAPSSPEPGRDGGERPDDAPPPGIIAWTLTPWAADALGLEMDEPGGDDKPARWVKVRRDEDGNRLANDRPIVAPWHRWERLAPWIGRLSEDRRKALMVSGGPREPETLKDERSGEEIRLCAGIQPDDEAGCVVRLRPIGGGLGGLGSGPAQRGVAILRDLKELGKAGRKTGKGSKGGKGKAKGKAKGKRDRRAG